MKTQIAVIKPAERKYETTCHDDIIVLLGCELDLLALEYHRLDDVASETTDSLNRIEAEQAHEHTYEKMKGICSTLSGLKAGSLEAAAVQMRAVSYYSTRTNEDVTTKMNALLFSVVGALEVNGGFDRNRWAGDFFLGTNDPFERIEA